ncbi:MAG: DHHA1 domain-containing protein [Dehalococcoidia bacterium]|jgi:oligoribonuclease NrnB/cAMP/cGMP phosphodiesterase (DHH superfamily)
MPTPLVIHHNDNDGFCAAWLANKALTQGGLVPEFFETNYGQEPPEVKDRDVFILDFSYSRDVLLKLKEYAKALLVIDHHKTAQAALEGLGFCIFDMNKAGCQLTREYFGLPQHWIVDYVEDRDLWKWCLPQSKEVNATLHSYPKTFTGWDKIASTKISELAKEGIAILRYQNRLIERATLYPETINIGGHTIPIVNSTVLQSEIAQKLAEGQPFSAVYSDKINGDRTFSLRSTGDFDVSEIAKQFGGGGHKNAAGYTITQVPNR